MRTISRSSPDVAEGVYSLPGAITVTMCGRAKSGAST